MYNKVFKNYQVNMGVPFQVKTPVNFQTIKSVPLASPEIDHEESVMTHQVSREEILERAREEADLILKEARYEAMRLVENAEKEIEESRQAAEEEARRTGYEEGFNEAKKQYEDLLQEAEFIREHARVEYKEVLAGIESDAINVILDIARKVIGVELSFNKEDMLYLVKQAFDKCANKENMVLKVSPEDYDYLISNKEKLLSMVEGIGELEIRKDSSLKLGACMVETAFGSVDASVQTKMSKIEHAFRHVIRK